MNRRSTSRLRAVLRWRDLRWVACAALVPTLWACSARKLVAPVGGPSQVIKNRFQQSVNRGRAGTDAAHPCWELVQSPRCVDSQLLQVCYDVGCTAGARPTTKTDALVTCSVRS